jgi:hypothetical protein
LAHLDNLGSLDGSRLTEGWKPNAWENQALQFWRQRRAIIGTRDRLYLPRLLNWLRRRTDFMSARMEMHCIPQADVVSIVAGAGGRVTEVDQEWTTGYQSCRYWVRKD